MFKHGVALVGLLGIWLGVVAAQNGCLQFVNSAICAPWTGSVFRATSAYNDTKSFDAYNYKLMENQTSYLKSFGDVYGCPNWDGSTLRYRFSLLCAYAVDQAGFPQHWPNSSVFTYPACKGQSSVLTPICKSTCRSARDSIAALFDNPKFCTDKSLLPSKQAQSRQQTLTIHDTICGSTNIEVSTADVKCYNGQGMELEEKSCGYFNKKEGEAYCKTPNGSADPCCASASAGSNTGAIVGGIFGALAFIALAAGGYIFYRKKSGNPIAMPFKKKRDSASFDRAAKGFTIYGDNGNTNAFAGGNGKQEMLQSPRPPVESVYDPTADYNYKYESMYQPQENDNRYTQDMASAPAKMKPKSILKPTKESPQQYFSNLPESNPPTSMSTLQKKRQSHIPALDNTQVIVIAPYAAQLDDELELKLGDIIIVEESFDDGWAVGRNLRGDDGCFPLACTKSKVGVEVPKTMGGRVVSLHYK